jgi:hypothetical protein
MRGFVSDEALSRFGVLFGDRRFAELSYLVHPSWSVAQSDFDGKGWMPNGLHGYDAGYTHSGTTFLSNKGRSRSASPSLTGKDHHNEKAARIRVDEHREVKQLVNV